MCESEAMSGQKQQKLVAFLAESHNDFQYEEGLTEGEKNLEATVQHIQAEATAAAADATSVSHQSETVDRFLRNFLSQMAMTETLDIFQSEWHEMVQKGPVDTQLVGVVPDVYTDILRVVSELRDVQRDGEEYRLAAAAGAGTLQRAQKERDFHRLRRNRVDQERNQLTQQMRKLEMQCSTYEPAGKRINEKYQAVLKQTMLLTLERDNALGQSAQHNISFWKDAGEEGAVDSAAEPRVNMTSHQGIQPRPPTPANVQRSQTRVKSGKANVC